MYCIYLRFAGSLYPEYHHSESCVSAGAGHLFHHGNRRAHAESRLHLRLWVLYRLPDGITGETIGLDTYFWLIMTPLLTVVLWVFTTSSRELQAENKRLMKKSANLATVDENTDLRNSVSFQKDASLFTGIATRYKIPLTLLVIKVKYWSEIRRLIPDDQLSEAIYDVSQLSQSSIRTNDALYLLDKDDALGAAAVYRPGRR